MKKISAVLFILCFLLLAAVPSVGILMKGTSNGRENTSSFPETKTDGHLNINYLKEAGNYFEKHFALRNEMLEADASLMELFQESNTEKVVKGTDGWLYYASSTDDFLGQHTMSGRSAFNAANNLKLLEEFVTEKGARFVFTVAPNKNSLYGEHMPSYLSHKASDVKNINLLGEKMKDLGNTYFDIFSLLAGKQDEDLYLKRDSHWNNKTALLVYDELLNSLSIEHDSYETAKALRTKTCTGDLCQMVYPISADDYPDWNYDYDCDDSFTYKEGEQVEDDFIVTENKKGNGSLLMFRDSFGNSLLPFFAENFESACFSKAATYNIEEYMDTYHPGLVIAEKVERNISEYALTPAVMSAPEREKISASKESQGDTTLNLKVSETDENYYEITGYIDPAKLKDDSHIYIQITDQGKTKNYEAFTVTDEDGQDNGYLMYIKRNQIRDEEIKIAVLAGNDKETEKIAEKTLEAEVTE